MSTPLRIVLVENSEDDAQLVLSELRRGGYEPIWRRVDSAETLGAALNQEPWDLIVSDYTVPRFTELEAVRLVHEHDRDIPVIVVSSQLGEEFAVAAMKAGAADYVRKDSLTRLVPAIERELREAEVRRARRRAEAERVALLEVARDISGTLDRDEMLGRVHRRVAALLPCDRVATFYWEPGRGKFRIVGQHGLPAAAREAAATVTFAPGEAVVERAMRGETVLINDCHAQTWVAAELFERFELAAVVGVPLIVGGHLIGVLVAARTAAGHGFDAREVQLFEGIARQLALAIGTVELYRAQEEETRVSAALARVGQQLIVSLDQPGLLDRLCRITTGVLECDSSHTILWDPAQQAYCVVAGYGDAAEHWESMQVLRIPSGVIATLIERLQRQEVVQVVTTEAQTLLPVDLLRQYGMSGTMCAALRRGEELIGVHTADYRGERQRFTLHQERIFRGLAQLASLAIEHARVIEELERANRLKYDFVATMSHELRTPLNVILGYSDLLLEGEFGVLAASQADVCGRIDKSARQLLELINATLDLSRLEGGKLTVELKEVRLADFLRDLEVETRDMQQKPGLNFIWQVPLRLPRVQTDPLKLKVVVKNLIGNAVKFTEHGSVTVSATARNGGVELAVIDTGIGITPDARPIIFEPFRQGEHSMTRRYGGVGLGLYIVRRLVDLMGGTIAVDSDVGRGSTFSVWLPTTRGRSAPSS